jgi:hypothetical protein
LHAQLLGNSIQFVEVEPFASPRVRQRFERDVETDLVPESEAIRDGSGEVIDANVVPLDAMFFDAEIEDPRRDVDDPEWRTHQTRHARASWNGNPDLMRKLSADLVKSQCRGQADDGTWDRHRGDHEVMALGDPLPRGETIPSGANPFQRARPGHPRERAGVDALIGNFASPQDRSRPSESQEALYGVLTMRHYDYT